MEKIVVANILKEFKQGVSVLLEESRRYRTDYFYGVEDGIMACIYILEAIAVEKH